MCGIWFSKIRTSTETHHKHRGPDSSVVIHKNGNTFAFDRLAINGLGEDGEQPFVDDDIIVMCNGEIYNHNELRSIVNNKPKGGSDCEIISKLLAEYEPEEAIQLLDGVFAIVATVSGSVIAARDPIGVRPLFYGYDEDDNVFFSSEMKGLLDYCKEIKDFPPGHVMIDGVLTSKFHGPSTPFCRHTLQNMLVASVKKRLMTDRPVGFFLSGGLDSSLICAIGAKLIDGPINTFSIGIGDSPDLECAKKVSEFIGSKHTEIRFTVEEGLDAIKNVIWALETYDCTTIRASVPMFLMSKYVSENTDIKVILSGEGADELFGGYLYFHYAKTPGDFQDETRNLLKNVHMHDVRRADRCTAAHGLELRVPFFDQALMKYVSSINPRLKMPSGKMEKAILRSSFEGWLPDDILWRQKNGMSDAVGYSWVDAMRMICDKLELPDTLYLRNPPTSKEELFYRHIYCQMFGKHDTLEHVWRPKWTNQTDPSAAKLDVFKRDPEPSQ